MSTPVDFQTCGVCGREGEVRYDNRHNRRCSFCWERVDGPIFIVQDEAGDPAPTKEESEPTPVKPTKKGK